MKRLACGTVCTLAVLAGGAAAADAACTDTWTGAVSNQWGTGGNWSNGSSPGGNNPAENVCLPSGAANYPVVLTDFTYPIPNVGLGTAHGAQINDLDIGSGAGVIVEGVGFEDQGDAYHEVDLTIDGSATIEHGGILEETSTDSGSTANIDNGNGGLASITGHGSITDDGSFVATASTTQTSQLHDQLHLPLSVGSDGTVTVTHDPSVPGGNLDIDGGQQVTNDGNWTVDPGAVETVTHNPLQTGPTTLTNNGSYANNGASVVSGGVDVFDENGPETGNPVQIENAAQLTDQSGTGAFALDLKNGTLAGTIPAGQTVTLQGTSYGNGYANTVAFAAPGVTNNGTLDVHVLNVSTDVALDVEVQGAPLVNHGTVNFLNDSPTLGAQLDIPITNQPGAMINQLAGTTIFTGGQQVTNNGTISISPGANLNINANPFLSGNESFTNGGTIAPQIAAGTTGTLTLDHNLNATLGGSVAPQLVGGYVPAVGTEVQAIPVKGATITGTFAAVGGGFAADYSHLTGNAPNYIGLVYQAAVSTGPPPSGGGTAAKAPTVGKPTVKGSIVTLKLSCAAGAACKKTTITETVTEKVKGKAKKGKKAKPKTKRIVVGTASATLAAGTSKTVRVKLNKTGTALLAKAKGHHLAVTVKVIVGGKVTKSSKLTLSATKAKHGKGKTHKAKHKS